MPCRRLVRVRRSPAGGHATIRRAGFRRRFADNADEKHRAVQLGLAGGAALTGEVAVPIIGALRFGGAHD